MVCKDLEHVCFGIFHGGILISDWGEMVNQ